MQKLYPHKRTIQIEISSRMVEAGNRLQRRLGVPDGQVIWIVADVCDIELKGMDFIYFYRPVRPEGKGRTLPQGISLLFISYSCVSVQFSFDELYQPWMHDEVLPSIFLFLWSSFDSPIQVIEAGLYHLSTHDWLEPISKLLDTVTGFAVNLLYSQNISGIKALVHEVNCHPDLLETIFENGPFNDIHSSIPRQYAHVTVQNAVARVV